MLTKTFPFLDHRRITPDFAARLQMLADDCARLVHDAAFVAARLKTAPMIDQYVPLTTPVGLHLVGQVTGHPLRGAGVMITSPLWFADPDGMWVRTMSRFYALGRPADPAGRDHIPTSVMRTFDGRDDDWPEGDD